MLTLTRNPGRSLPSKVLAVWLLAGPACAQWAWLVRDINTATTEPSDPEDLLDVDGTLFFSAWTGREGRELWKSDGTEPGTFLLDDLHPAAFSSTPAHFVSLGDLVFFAADDGLVGRELWAGEAWPGALELTVTKTGDGSGSVTSRPPGISCGGDCLEAYVFETSVELIADPDDGSRFAGWGGDPDCHDGQVTMEAPRDCVAARPGAGSLPLNTGGGAWPAAP